MANIAARENFGMERTPVVRGSESPRLGAPRCKRRASQRQDGLAVRLASSATAPVPRSRPECAPMPSDNTCWVVSDGRAGNERQALALAHGLGFDTRVMRMKLREPWQGLAPRLTLGVRHAIVAEGGVRFEPPWPEVAIGAGRRAALV